MIKGQGKKVAEDFFSSHFQGHFINNIIMSLLLPNGVFLIKNFYDFFKKNSLLNILQALIITIILLFIQNISPILIG